MRVRVAIIDDHKLIRDGITAFFADNAKVEIVAGYDDGQSFIESLPAQPVDVALLDMQLPGTDGLGVARLLRQTYPEMKILFVTMSEAPEKIEQIVGMGAHGYLLKDSGLEEMARAIDVVAHGATYYSSKLLKCFLKDQPLKQGVV